MSPVWVRWFNELYNFKEELEGFYHEEVPVDLDPEMSATLERLEMVENETFGREPPPSLDEIYSRLDSLEAEIASMPGTFTQTLTSGVTDRLITMDASPSTLILSDDNTDQTLTGNLGALNLLTPAGVYSFGSVAANTDITINFPGTTSSGQFKWMEDEAYLNCLSDVMISAGSTAFRLYFLDAGSSIRHDGTGLTIYDDTRLWLQTTEVQLGTNLLVDTILKFMGNTNDGTITWDEDPGQFVLANPFLFQDDIACRFGSDADIALSASVAGQLNFTPPANTDIQLNFIGTTTSGAWKWMEDEDRFETPDDLKVDADFNVTGELAGAKMLIPFMRSNITADAYATYGAITLTGDRCPVMPRAGSVTGLAINVYGSGATSAGDVVVSVRKNDVDVLSVTLTFTLVAGVVKGYVTQARGTDTFAAGDVLTVYFDFTTFAGTVGNGCILVEVQFDT